MPDAYERALCELLESRDAEEARWVHAWQSALATVRGIKQVSRKDREGWTLAELEGFRLPPAWYHGKPDLTQFRVLANISRDRRTNRRLVEREKFVVDVLREVGDPRAYAAEPMLKHLSELVCSLPGVEGAGVLAVDDQHSTLGYEHHDLAVRCPAPELAQHLDIRPGKRFPSGRREVPQPLLAVPGEVVAWPIASTQGSGMLLVRFEDHLALARLADVVQMYARFCQLPLRDNLEHAAFTRLSDFVAAVEDDESPVRLVGRLKQAFRTDSVSLFLSDPFDDRYITLAATTDPELRKENIRYPTGKGLTGWVAMNGPVRLTDRESPAELRHKIDPARTMSDAKFETFRKPLYRRANCRVMAVPLRRGGEVVGVIRMTRALSRFAFSEEEEFALRFFARLWARVLAENWDQKVGETLLAHADPVFVLRKDKGLVTWKNQAAAQLDPMGSLEQPLARARHTKGRQLDHAGRRLQVSYHHFADDRFSPPVQYVLCNLRDTTAELDLHKRIHGLCDQVGLAYFLADEQGITKLTSTADSRISRWSISPGFDRAQLYKDPEDRARLVQALKKDGSLARHPVRIVNPNGSEILVEAYLQLAGGQIEGLYRQADDQVQMQALLGASTDRLMSQPELLAHLTDFLAFQDHVLSDVSHQVISPIASLIRNLGFRQERCRDEVLAGHLARLVAEAKDVHDLAAVIMSVEKSRNNGLNLGPAKHPADVVDDRIERFEQRLAEKTMTVVKDPKLAELSAVDAGLALTSVLHCLFDNACRYSLPGTTLEIEATEDLCGLALTNLGYHIGDKERDFIFERARQGVGAMYTGEGAGLGLYWVKTLCRRLGWEVTCASERKGTNSGSTSGPVHGYVRFEVRLEQEHRPPAPANPLD